MVYIDLYIDLLCYNINGNTTIYGHNTKAVEIKLYTQNQQSTYKGEATYGPARCSAHTLLSGGSGAIARGSATREASYKLQGEEEQHTLTMAHELRYHQL